MIASIGINSSYSVGSSFDSDAQAFFTAASITDGTQKTAINTLVLAGKANGWWTPCSAIYPMVGGNATSHSYNLKNTAQFQLTFSGGWTHSANGALPDGTTGYADTGLNASTNLTNQFVHLSSYLRNAHTHAGTFVGTILSSDILRFRVTLSGFVVFDSSPTSETGSPATTEGYYTAVNSNTSFNTYKNGSTLSPSSSGIGGTVFPNSTFYIAATNNGGAASLFSDQQTAFVTIGADMNSTIVAAMYTDIQAYQTSLSRQV